MNGQMEMIVGTDFDLDLCIRGGGRGVMRPQRSITSEDQAHMRLKGVGAQTLKGGSIWF